MWTILAADDTERMDRCAAIMRQMDRGYRGLEGGHLGLEVRTGAAEVHYYRQGDVDAVLVFAHHERHRQWRVWCSGFLGPITAAEFCRLGIDRVKEFMDRRGIAEVTAIRRLHLEHQPLDQCYAMVPDQPDFTVIEEHSLRECLVWRLRRAEPAGLGIEEVQKCH